MMTAIMIRTPRLTPTAMATVADPVSRPDTISIIRYKAHSNITKLHFVLQSTSLLATTGNVVIIVYEQPQ